MSTKELGHVYFIGIGGAHMSGIARILLTRGSTVSGSDARESAVLAGLRSLGATIHIGHDAANVAGVDTVVYSTAIRPDNPELVEAHRLGLRVLRRADALAAVMVGSRGVAIAGTAGKTTTTSMLTVAAQVAGADPSFAIGGALNESGLYAHQGSGDLFIVEADESDGTFLLLEPEVAVVTNVDADHLDQHGTREAYVEAFKEFVRRIRPDGVLIVCADDAGSRRLGEFAQGIGVRVRSYGLTADADMRISDLQVSTDSTSYTATCGGFPYLVRVGSPGRHMALNAAAALLAGIEMGLSAEVLVGGIARYTGVHRRFELKGIARDIRVYDDYAHHPTKVAAQLEAARIVAGLGRVVVVFQPHLYSRTRDFAAEFGVALSAADEVVVMDVYGSREDPIPGVTGTLVADVIGLPEERVHYEPSWSQVAPLVARIARPGDVVITMGAGDVTLLGPEVLTELEREPQ